MQPLPPEIRKYLNQRGISDEIILSHGIGWTGKKISIPIRSREGKFFFNKYRRSPFEHEGPKYTYDKGSSSRIYNIQTLEKSDTVVIAEGEFDVLILESNGIPAVTSTGGAGTFKNEWAGYFKDKTVYICYDNDEAGIKGALRVQSLLPNAKIIEIPEFNDIKDVTDFFMHHEMALRKFVILMNDAVSYRFPVEPPTFDRPQNLSTYLSELKTFMEDFMMLKRTLLNEEKSAKYADYAIQYCAKKTDQYSKKIVHKKRSDLPDDRIAKAKTVPISSIVKFNSMKFANCLFHNEATPSMHYYEKENACHCFSCGAHADVIDVYQKLNNCSLPEALTALIKLT